MTSARSRPRAVPASTLRWKADLALAGCSLVWGVTFVVVQDALRDASVLVFLLARFLLATATLAWIYRRHLSDLHPGLWRAGSLIGLFMFAGYALQTAGLRWTTPSKAAFITGSSVVLVPIFEALLGRQRPGYWLWLGALTALGGLYLLTLFGAPGGRLNRGDVLVMGCAVMFALHIIVVGHYSPGYPSSLLTLTQVGATALLSALALPVAGMTGWERPYLVWSPRLVGAVIVTAVGATAVAFSLQVWAQRFTTASHVAILFSLEPVFAAVTSLLLGAERLNLRTLAGGGLVLCGVLLAELKGSGPLAPESAVSGVD